MEKSVTRRSFVGLIIRGGIFATLAGMLLPALKYLWPVMSRGPSNEMQEVASEDEIPVWGSKKVILSGSALLLLRTPTEIKALSAICTHLGCVVDWDGQKKQILCPCHAGVFDIECRNVSGPPPRPLPVYKVSVANGKVYVKL